MLKRNFHQLWDAAHTKYVVRNGSISVGFNTLASHFAAKKGKTL